MAGTKMGAAAIRDRVMNARDRRFKDVPVPEWDDSAGGEPTVIRIFSLTGEERDALMEGRTDEDGKFDNAAMAAQLTVLCSYSPESGTDRDEEHRIFTEADLGWLNAKNAGVLERLGRTAMDLSGLGREAKEKAGKGSSVAPNGSSSSTSRAS